MISQLIRTDFKVYARACISHKIEQILQILLVNCFTFKEVI